MKQLRLEKLEDRSLLASDWQNPTNRLDVDGSGLVIALDVLLIANDINQFGVRSLPSKPSGYTGPLCDVNGDGHMTPLDALLVVNAINKYSDPLTVTVNLTDQSDQNRNHVILESQADYVGQTLPDVRVQVQALPSLEVLAESQADATGRIALQIQTNIGLNHLRFVVKDDRGRINQTERLLRRGDVLLDWNAAALDVIRETTVESSSVPGLLVKPPPPLVARNLAMIHIAMFDAINAIDRTYVSYAFDGSGFSSTINGASLIAAAASAAHRVASELYSKPHDLEVWDKTLSESLKHVPEGTSKTNGIAVGRAAADAILAMRADDGASGPANYTPDNLAGRWRPTLPEFAAAVLPQWPEVTPFAMTSGQQFRPAPPPELSSTEYAVALDEVMRLGSRTSTQRTIDQTGIASFWADGGGTATPPGHWNQIAADIALQHNNSTVANARMFALLNIALADAAIASWDAKYAYELWRPITAIRTAGEDGNPETSADPNWVPLLVTPAFPTYTSGHSTFSGAAAAVLGRLFGNEISFSTYADRGIGGAWPPPEDVSLLAKRSFGSFAAAAQEAGMSRIYAGIHFQFDNTSGLNAGQQIGELVANQLARPRTVPA